jgi:adenine-specific DNA-methyltransferase
MARTRKSAAGGGPKRAESYDHPKATSLLRPDVGTQAQFKKKKPPKTYRYDSSISPALDWDGGNPARERAEWLLACVEEAAKLPAPHVFDPPRELKGPDGSAVATCRGLQDAVDQLRRVSRPFLNWAGKAERLSFDVPTLPLFVHERLSTKAILETLRSHRRDRQISMMDLFADPALPIRDQVLRAYEHVGGWTNRLILGDSLVVMNSLLQYEGLGGQVQMIYMDPPYGVKFGSNFQPFVRKRDVKHNDDEDMTREPEMVKAYRDTWELGLHSYLSYLRDRLLLCRELLNPTGSVFVQISDENLHHLLEVMEEVFGPENVCGLITVRKTTGAGSPAIGTSVLPATVDYLVWCARDGSRVKYRQLYLSRLGEGWVNYDYVRLPDGTHRRMILEERESWERLPKGAVVYRRDNLTSTSTIGQAADPFDYMGQRYYPGRGGWKTSKEGLKRLALVDRLEAYGKTLSYRRFATDFPWYRLSNLWSDTVTGGYVEERYYVVQTNSKVAERCLLMTTDPGDLVLDPTCGSGTTAYVAEQWGRRWITIDTSRVPLALARQRLLTATYPYYQLKEEARGPAGGFVYVRKRNSKGEEIGGIVPHVTLKSIANDEPPEEEVLVDRPEVESKITRVSGAFTLEATIPTPVDWEGDGLEDSGLDPKSYASFLDRMLEVLRRSPVLHVGGGKTVTLRNVRPPAKSLALSAEAMVDVSAAGGAPTIPEVVQEALEKNGKRLPFSGRPVAIVFGPENGAVSEKLVWEAAREAGAKRYAHLYVIGFAIQPNARKLVEDCEAAVGVQATYVQATPDLMMGDLLKTMRSSQIFSVCGLPEVKLRKVKPPRKGDPPLFQAELLGLDVFDPATMQVDHRPGGDVPAWLLDTDYNALCFHVCQAFFPRTAAWDDLKRSLRGQYEDSVWEHLAGTVSAPFEAGEHGQVAVKVLDDRGNELLVVKPLAEAG